MISLSALHSPSPPTYGARSGVPHLRVLEPASSYGGDTDVPDPFDDADALEALGDEIATLAAHLTCGDQRMLELIADFDHRRGWELGGHRSCAHWLAYRAQMDLHSARERVRAARGLASLPETSAAMARGELSFSAVRALTRVATPENEEDLLELARGCTVAQLERVVRAVRIGGTKDEAARERVMHMSRTLSVFPGDDGMYVVKGRLMPEVGALLMRAIEAAGDALYRERPVPGARTGDSARAAARLRADAVGLLAERALGVGFGGGESDSDEKGAGNAGAHVPAGTRAARPPAPVSGSRAERYQVLLHVDAATLGGEGDGERSHLADGVRVPAGTCRRLACDTALVQVRRAPDDSILDVGRRTRSIPPALRRALEVRDRGCRFPDHSPAASGARGLRFTDAHHVIHWADGGETSLSNTLLLCRHHHHLVHEGGWKIQWWGEGRPAFFDPRGGAHYEGCWQPGVLTGREAKAFPNEEPDGPGADAPDGWTASARWKREEDIPDAVLFQAHEALESDGDRSRD